MTTHSRTKPNILLLMADQFRPDCIAALGNPAIRTPNLDRLAREGTSFQQCYTPSPVCVPARHSLSCGVAPHVSGCVDNINARRLDRSFMECLADAGYQTHGAGKMHFSEACGDWGFTSRDTSEEVELHDETDDYKRFVAEAGYAHVYDPHGVRSESYYLPQPSQLPEHLHNSHWVVDRSIDFLRQRDRDKPFLLWTSFIKPHPPFESPNPWGRLYRMHEMEMPFLPPNAEDNWTFWNRIQNRYKYVEGFADNRNLARMIRAAYYGTISFIDYNIGRLLAALGDELDNTLVLFTADHGELLGDFGCYGKRSMLDPSVRVPLLARLPGVLGENARCDAPVSLLDLFPTLLELAGAPADMTDREGVSLFKTCNAGAPERVVFSQFSQGATGLYMAADGAWKYIYSAADDKEWLFDLAKDPREVCNLAGDAAFRGHLQRLRQACIERFTTGGCARLVDGRDWRRFPAPLLPAQQSDEGLLFQDPPPLDGAIRGLGEYARPTEFKNAPQFQWLTRLVEQSREG